MKLASSWLMSESESSDEDEETETQTQEGEQTTTPAEPDSALFFNKFIQLRDGEASGLLWTARIQTKGDATGTGFFMGKELGHGQIVDTDYDTYVIGWSCEELPDGKMRQKACLSVRDPDMSREDLQKLWDKAEQLMTSSMANDEHPFDWKANMVPVTQGSDKCTYYEFGD